MSRQSVLSAFGPIRFPSCESGRVATQRTFWPQGRVPRLRPLPRPAPSGSRSRAADRSLQCGPPGPGGCGCGRRCVVRHRNRQGPAGHTSARISVNAYSPETLTRERRPTQKHMNVDVLGERGLNLCNFKSSGPASLTVLCRAADITERLTSSRRPSRPARPVFSKLGRQRP